jgi:Flp pilus assembly protein protease CpaA
MELVITLSSISSFTFMVILFIIYCVFDIRYREIPNRAILIGGVLGLGVILFSGHLAEHALLHLTAVILTGILGYVLFRIGSLGGADVKILLTIAIISPGVEFASWSDPILEGIMVVGILLSITLMAGYLVSKRKTDDSIVIPLIPIMFCVYLVLQLLALF